MLKNQITFSALIFLAVFVSVGGVQAQNSKLAQEYFNNGEFEKAASIYKKLYDKQKHNNYYFERYVASLMEAEAYTESKNVIQKQIKAQKENPLLYVLMAQLLDKQNQTEKAEKWYQKAIQKLKPNANEIQRLALAFRNAQRADLAIETYEKGRSLLKDPKLYSFQLADLYRREAETEKMIEAYLYSLAANPRRLNSIQSYFQKFLSEEEFTSLQYKLYDFIEQFPDQKLYPEMLQWYFVTQKDFKNAFRQAKALDARYAENGARIYNLAQTAQNHKAFDAAIDGYQYLIENKNPRSRIVIDAQKQRFKCLQNKITSNPHYTKQELEALEQDYESFLKSGQVNRAEIAGLIIQYAAFQAKFVHNIDKAVELLKDLIQRPGINPYQLALAKLDLGDYYLIKNEIWEATLLYAQVDKAFLEEHLGHIARFKNAKLSYYNGDFEWAQTQFDVLKASTSKLIANDALELSVFIQDNLGLDTTDVPMRMYAQAELLQFQNKYDQAFAKLDELINRFPDHGLQDDIYYLEANLYVKLKQYDEAIKKYKIVIDRFSDDIRADNAMFELASIYETIKNDPKQALALYERLFMDYSDSIYAVDARKRFRAIRSRLSEKESDLREQ